ncbi:hypothetical protein [Amycolatopsis sp. cmx-4-54]
MSHHWNGVPHAKLARSTARIWLPERRRSGLSVAFALVIAVPTVVLR